MKQRIIILSNRLPISVTNNDAGSLTLERSNGGLATALSSVMSHYDATWFGWPGTTEKIHRWQLKVLGADKGLRAINIDAELISKYYDSVSNNILWPLLHGFHTDSAYQSTDWEAYRKVNQRFAKAVQKMCRPKDMIWVHDYHLMLVPQMLRDMGVENRIGFFLHTPFARADCLDQLAEHREVLQSLAQVDVLGLQTDRDVTALKTAFKQQSIVPREGAHIRSFPIGVDYAAYNASYGTKGMRRELAKALPVVAHKQVILSVSRLDYTKGILEQLKAYEHVLQNPVTSQRLLYKLIVAPSREAAAGYRELKETIQSTVDRINAAYGAADYQPIDYTYRNCNFDEVSTWYTLADTLLVTPRIDGMNLVVKEYVATRRDNQGVLVLSKSIGAASQLHDAILVEPDNVSSITSGLVRALTMPPEERAKRFKGLRTNVQSEDVYWWLREFLGALGHHPKKPLFSHRLHVSRLRAGVLSPRELPTH